MGFCAIFRFFVCFSPVCFVLSVPVQEIALKDSSPKWPVMCRMGRKTLLTHSLRLHDQWLFGLQRQFCERATNNSHC